MKKIKYLFLVVCMLMIVPAVSGMVSYADTSEQLSQFQSQTFAIGISSEYNNTYMDIEVVLKDLEPNTVYPVFLGLLSNNDVSMMADETGKYQGEEFHNPKELKTDAFGVVKEHFYLKNGQYITITEIPEESKYFIQNNESGFISQYVLNGDLISNERISKWNEMGETNNELIINLMANKTAQADLLIIAIVVCVCLIGLVLFGIILLT